MADLPAEVSYFTLTGKLVRTAPDSVDASAFPDALPIAGQITAKAEIGKRNHNGSLKGGGVVTVGSATPPLTVVVADLPFVLDGTGAFSVPMVDPRDPSISPNGWAISLDFSALENVSIPSFTFDVPPEVTTLDISTVTPVEITGGTVAFVNEAAASAASAAASAASAAASAALVGAPADVAVAAIVGNPASATSIELAADYLSQADAATDYAGSAFFKRRAAGGATTTGDVILLGSHAYAPVNVATGLVAGGAPLYENVVGGNLANVDTTTSNLTGAAALTGTNGNWNFVLSGYDSVVNGWAVVCNGYHHKVDVDANHITIGGGSKHIAAAATAYGTIGGGTQNQVAGTNPTVAGGNANQATGNGATVGGGQTNIASGTGSTISGGVSNTANNAQATVVGGSTCIASGNSATVVGGLTNTAGPATGATVAGGRDNVASGAYSLATGRQAVAIESGQHAHAQAAFAVAGDAQINRWALKKATTDATAANLECDTGAPPVIPENTTWGFSALIVARRADVDGDNAAFKVEGCLKRDAASTAAFVGTPTVTAIAASAGAAAWTVTTGTYSVGTLRLIVTGEAAKTIRWVARLEAASATG